jgi:hypothetical protein
MTDPRRHAAGGSVPPSPPPAEPFYLSCDVPPGVLLSEWRKGHAPVCKPGPLHLLRWAAYLMNRRPI